jgi:hypothetical protein
MFALTIGKPIYLLLGLQISKRRGKRGKESKTQKDEGKTFVGFSASYTVH